MQYHLYSFDTRNEVERGWLISILTDFDFEGFEETFKKWTPRPVFDFYKIEDLKPNYLKYPVSQYE